MTTTASPVIRELDRKRCEEILSRNHVGRIAFTRGNRLEIQPVHYVYSEGWLFGRTSPGTKIEMTGTQWWPVAFEVDETEHLFRWRSVLVHGGFYVLPSTQSEVDVAHWRKAVELLRSLIPASFAEHDPVPFRTIVFGISLTEVTGREAFLSRTRPASRRASPDPNGRALPRPAARGRRPRPVLVLGPPSVANDRIREVLTTAGYGVLTASNAQDLVLIAACTEPRAVIAHAHPEDGWRRLLEMAIERRAPAIPLILVGEATLPIEGVSGVVAETEGSEEPGFARRILEEVQHAEQGARTREFHPPPR
jgi:uncharacterized protein